MNYKSCHILEHGLIFDRNYVAVCCIIPNKNSRIIKLIDNYYGEKIDWDKLFEDKNKLREQHKKGQILPGCEGCYNLEDRAWDGENYIDNIFISHWLHCNCKCFYCATEEERKIQNKHKPYKLLPILKAMKEKNILRPGGYISLTGGEPTVLKEFDNILKFLYEIDLKTIVVNSSGIKYSKELSHGIKLGKIELTISIDSYDKNLYKKIKRVDAFDKVVSNIEKYIASQTERKDLVRVKYIIIPGVNDSIEEIEKWIQMCKKLQVQHIIIDVENKWFREHFNNIPDSIKSLILYVQKQALKYDMNLSYYSNVSQIIAAQTKSL